MNTVEFVADNLARAEGLLKMTLADFTEHDMFVRPLPNANHAAWQLGHLIGSERGMLAACGAKMPELPPGFPERFNTKTATVDDPAQLASKAELLETLATVRAAAVAWARSLKAEDLEKPAPEQMRDYAPTVGHLLLMAISHQMMHIGQFQVIRRKLGKPVLF